MTSRSPIRNSLWLLIAVMAFFAMAASSPQCASSDDAAVNPTLAPLAAGNDCIIACNEESKARKRVLNIQHKACITACNRDMECRDECTMIKAAIQVEINEDRDDCKLVCQHEQGAATGGQ